jgi:hypothetical protein
MPNNQCYAIFDSQTGLWLTAYTEPVEYCLWGNQSDAVCFQTAADRDRVVGLLNEGGTSRFIGQNPRPR